MGLTRAWAENSFTDNIIYELYMNGRVEILFSNYDDCENFKKYMGIVE